MDRTVQYNKFGIQITGQFTQTIRTYLQLLLGPVTLLKISYFSNVPCSQLTATVQATVALGTRAPTGCLVKHAAIPTRTDFTLSTILSSKWVSANKRKKAKCTLS